MPFDLSLCASSLPPPGVTSLLGWFPEGHVYRVVVTLTAVSFIQASGGLGTLHLFSSGCRF